MRSSPLGEFADDDGIERPHHADLEEPEAGRAARLGEAEIPSAWSRSCQALPAATTPTRALRRVGDDPVEAVRARVGERGGELMG